MSPMLREVPVLEEPMARKRAAKRPTVNVAIEEDVVKSARLVSALTERPMSEIISEILRPILARMETDGMARRSAARPAPPKKGGGK